MIIKIHDDFLTSARVAVQFFFCLDFNANRIGFVLFFFPKNQKNCLKAAALIYQRVYLYATECLWMGKKEQMLHNGAGYGLIVAALIPVVNDLGKMDTCHIIIFNRGANHLSE